MLLASVGLLVAADEHDGHHDAHDEQQDGGCGPQRSGATFVRLPSAAQTACLVANGGTSVGCAVAASFWRLVVHCWLYTEASGSRVGAEVSSGP